MPKRILIINTGGTLSSVKSSKGLVPGMSSGDMLEELRGPDLQHSSQEEVMIIMGLW